MINTDNSGTITFKELKEGLRLVGYELMESEIKDLMDAHLANSVLCVGDYGNTFKGRNWRLKELFKMINIDNSGTITFEELKEGMRRVGSELMESEIKDFDGCESRCEGLDDSTVPEIKRCNLSNVILQLSAVGLALTSWRNLIAKLDTNGDKRILEKLIKSFNLSVPPRELQNKDPKFVLQSVMSRWLPLSDAILSMVVKHIPDPVNAQSFRISRLLPKREILDSDVGKSDVIAEAELVRKSVEACDSRPEAPYVAFVSKMFAVPIKIVFSGVLHAGQKVFVLSALYDPLKTVATARAGNIVSPTLKVATELSAPTDMAALMEGLRLLNRLATARAGNIVAIRGLGQHILKSATLASTKNCWPFSSMTFQVSPTLKVAIEPSAPTDMAALMEGLRLLNHAEPFVEISVSA
ncbi:elongation factor-like GTPase 1 [Tanacetum coccineum]